MCRRYAEVVETTEKETFLLPGMKNAFAPHTPKPTPVGLCTLHPLDP